MSLIDSVINWNEKGIECGTFSHKTGSNPMLKNGELSSFALIEYGAQAAAIHAGLNSNSLSSTKPAYVGAVKDFHFDQRSIPTASHSEMIVRAQCAIVNSGGAIYTFNVMMDGVQLVMGQLVLVNP